MDINKMTRKQFKELPYLKGSKPVSIDSIVLLPTRRKDSSGYRIYIVICCERNKAIGKLYDYDTFSIIMESKWNRVGIDCLQGSGLMRIFLPTNQYEICPLLHQAKIKENKNDN